MQTNRLFEIIYILLNKKIVTAKELAARFNVSTRTIYRDIDNLSLSGIPVYTEKGKGGGISLLPDFVLSKSILNEKEQNEILSALQGLSHVRTQETDHVLQKLSAIFNKTAYNWMEVDFTGWGYDDGDIFASFKTAILEQKIVEFDYYSTFGEKTRRKIEPLQLWFKSRAWYLKAFCLVKNDLRLFKLSRIININLTNEHFNERDLLNIKPNNPKEHQKQDITLRLKIAPEMQYRVLDEYLGCIESKEPDGSYILSVTWPEDNWVYGTILSFGEHIEVLSPPHVRDIIREKSNKISNNHSKYDTL